MKHCTRALAASLFLMTSCGDDPPSHSRGIEDIEQARKNADKNIFTNEREAQRHETAFVQLWDAMRTDDPFVALLAFPFEEIRISRPSEYETLSFSSFPIQRRVFSGSVDVLAPDIARRTLASAKSAGWSIAQSEWHHDTFVPAEAGESARSVVSFEVHCERSASSERSILKGKLFVQWSGRNDAKGTPVPGKLAVQELQLLQAKGPPPFREIAVIDPLSFDKPPSCSPLLARDLDGDGLSELVVVGANLMFHAKGDDHFDKENFLQAGSFPMPSNAGILADFTGDGHVDFVGASLRDLQLVLFEGDSKGRFTTPGSSCFSNQLLHPQVLTAGDIDSDGDLDLFLGQYRPPYLDGSMPTPYHDSNDGHPDFLLLNNGSGKFSDATESSGLSLKRNRRTYAASLVDLDADTDLDLVVTADFAGLDLYLNDGKGNFTDVTEKWAPERQGFGMSHVFGDVNGDGLQDLYFVGMSSTTARRLDRLGIARDDFEKYARMRAPMTFGNRLLLGQPGGGFRQSGLAAKIARTGWGWGSAAEDFDNDGDIDLFVANGHLSGKSARDYCTTYWCHDVYEGNSQADNLLKTFFTRQFQGGIGHAISWNGFEHNAFFLNKDNGQDFLGAAFLLGVAGEFDSRAVLTDDLDGDGRVDLLVVEYDAKTFGQRIHVYRNEWPASGNWIGVLPKGTAMGAKATVKSGERFWTRSLATGDSFNAQKASVIHFGLGDAKIVDYLEVRWPDGKVTRLTKPAVNQYHSMGPMP